MPKTKAESQPMLLNWPPSRGPMPNWMSAPNRYDIPAVKVERIEGKAPSIKKPSRVKKLASVDVTIANAWSMSYHVRTVASLTPDQAIVLLRADEDLWQSTGQSEPPASTFVLDIGWNHYLNKGTTARVTIKPYRMWFHRDKKWSEPRQDVGYLLWQIARVFVKLWREHKKWNPRGHDVSDLYFEKLSFRHNVLMVSLGS